MIVTFLKSDAAAEAYPDEPDEAKVELPENAQLTYGLLRDTLTDADIAAYDVTPDGYWQKLDDGTHWSDIVFGDDRGNAE